MKIEYEILVNQLGQDLAEIEQIQSLFDGFSNTDKRDFINSLITLILQSKPRTEDIEPAIVASGLKQTYTPCILIKKGMTSANLYKIAELPDNELSKALHLLLSVFKIAYKRRYILEKNNPDKWWYWDLSDDRKIHQLIAKY